MMTVVWVAITMIITSLVFIHRMARAGLWVPFILAENDIAYSLDLQLHSEGEQLAKESQVIQDSCYVQEKLSLRRWNR